MVALEPEIAKLITQIYQYKGRQELFTEQHPQNVTTLLRIAKIESTTASNRIEGIYTSSSRMQKLMAESLEPRNRDEQEIAGYRDVLDLIHNSYPYMPINGGTISQLHKNLYKYSYGALAGKWKSTDNVIEQLDAAGNKSVRFIPTPAILVDESITNLCNSYNDAIKSGIEPLLAIFTFILDFLSIHPFADGNGRTSRLLTLLLLYQSGFVVGRYISIEHIIEKTKAVYYQSLNDSSINWHSEHNDVTPFVGYSLRILLSAYINFEERVVVASVQKLSKSAQVEGVFATHLGRVTKADIRIACPNVSESLIEQVLKQLLDKGKIMKVGAGRSTSYVVSE